MITIGICLIYYGIAVWLYQVYGWVSTGEWAPYPVLAAWQALFGAPAYKLGPVMWWLLELPLSLVLPATGFGIIGLVFGLRRIGRARRGQLRRKWVAEQCKVTGRHAWAIPELVAKIERDSEGA